MVCRLQSHCMLLQLTNADLNYPLPLKGDYYYEKKKTVTCNFGSLGCFFLVASGICKGIYHLRLRSDH